MAPPVLELKRRLIESFAFVTVLPALSLMHTEIVDIATPLAAIGFGEAVAVICVGAPNPVNDTVDDACVSEPEDAVAVHASAEESLIVNFTVVPLDAVFPVAGLPAPPAGVVLFTIALQRLVVFGL